ncbi:MAG TPA: XrtA/PEP-CTERM system histidine kinase PrsK [Candidatus Cybelea sp.]|nr:XrtA/PEP-CTERM system histidine kinase PrsK [Candidatus Cybelea sp.]
MPIGALAFELCALAYAALAIAFLVRGGRGRADYILIAAAGITALWAADGALARISGGFPIISIVLGTSFRPLEILRDATWILLLMEIMALGGGAADLPSATGVRRAGRTVILTTVLAGVAVALAEIYLETSELGASATGLEIAFVIRIMIALGGLALLENLIRNSTEEGFWSIKYLGIGLGGIFAYDFFTFANALLFRAADPALLEIRGAVALLVVPLIVIGTRRSLLPDRRIGMSHRLVFHGAAIFGGGIYLLAMGVVGLYVRQFGGNFGVMLTGLFLFGAFLLLAVVLASGSLRSWLKVWLYKNLFVYKYDYREEWLRFINTIAVDQSGTNLRLRVIKSIANIVDSPGGALWQWEEINQDYELTESWNYSSLKRDAALGEGPKRFLAQHGWVVNLNDYRERADSYPDFAAPDWIAKAKEAWILVPLVHRAHLLGVVLLQQPRAPRTLNWEDFDLLKMSGRQAANYLAENAAVQALSAARELEIFNRRFAFVVHDIKTLISQLTLMLANASRHGSNPKFQSDLIASVGDTVDSMNRLLQQINEERKRSLAPTSVELVSLVERVAERRRKVGGANLTVECEVRPLEVTGDEYRVMAVLGHLVQNAMEAAGEGGNVVVRLGRSEGMAMLEVNDDGDGMEPAFIRDELFQPFRSTKDSGYGIGAYQCRELVRELQGRMNVHSVPGQGTTMRVLLPMAPAKAVEGAAARVQ